MRTGARVIVNAPACQVSALGTHANVAWRGSARVTQICSRTRLRNNPGRFTKQRKLVCRRISRQNCSKYIFVMPHEWLVHCQARMKLNAQDRPKTNPFLTWNHNWHSWCNAETQTSLWMCWHVTHQHAKAPMALVALVKVLSVKKRTYWFVQTLYAPFWPSITTAT